MHYSIAIEEYFVVVVFYTVTFYSITFYYCMSCIFSYFLTLIIHLCLSNHQLRDKDV